MDDNLLCDSPLIEDLDENSLLMGSRTSSKMLDGCHILKTESPLSNQNKDEFQSIDTLIIPDCDLELI